MTDEKGHTTVSPTPSEELYRFGADGDLRLYSYDRLFFSLYGYDAGTTRTYKYSFDLSPNWMNGRLESVNFNMHNAMFYPNAYINFNNDGYYTKHYYNGMERIASRLGDRNISINVNDPELQDRKDWQDSLIRKNVTEITGYEFLPVGEEQNPEDPKPVFELPQVGLTDLIPNTSSVYYYHSNHLGSTCYVTNENATVLQGFLYAPFGEITNEYNSSFGSSVLPKYSFNAKELDEETGMYYYEARYMAPPVFISREPLFEKYPTFSPYAYCANNPVNVIDPDGRDTVYFNLKLNKIKTIECEGSNVYMLAITKNRQYNNETAVNVKDFDISRMEALYQYSDQNNVEAGYTSEKNSPYVYGTNRKLTFKASSKYLYDVHTHCKKLFDTKDPNIIVDYGRTEPSVEDMISPDGYGQFGIILGYTILKSDFNRTLSSSEFDYYKEESFLKRQIGFYNKTGEIHSMLFKDFIKFVKNPEKYNK